MRPASGRVRIALYALLLLLGMCYAAEPLAKPASETGKPPDEVTLEQADRLVFNNRTRQGEASGHVVMRHEDGTLSADRVQFDLKRKTGTASGSPKFVDSENTITAEQVSADFGERRVVFRGKVELVNVRPQPKPAAELTVSAAPTAGESSKPSEPLWSGHTVITCDELEYYYRQKKAVATGHLRIVQDERTIEGRVANWDGKAETIAISGEVKVTTTKGESMQFQQATINLRDDVLEAHGPGKAHLIIEE